MWVSVGAQPGLARLGGYAKETATGAGRAVSSEWHFVRALVLVDTTSHGLAVDATADAFLAVADKRGLKKAGQDLSGKSFAFLGSASTSRMGARRSHLVAREFIVLAAVRSLNNADTRSSRSQCQAPTLVIAGEKTV